MRSGPATQLETDAGAFESWAMASVNGTSVGAIRSMGTLASLGAGWPTASCDGNAVVLQIQ